MKKIQITVSNAIIRHRYNLKLAQKGKKGLDYLASS